ncbi:MAG: 30S ribosomal protein S19 [Candidatus Diapherotrites archaeon]|nr:30S ribosomal protein S19 [Candidatus Diapherotrites archaeon]
MVRKEFVYRGKTLAELVSMSEEEFAKFAGTRIKRSILRGLDKKLLSKIKKAFLERQEKKELRPIRTQLRHFPVLPKMVGLRFAVHNGKEFLFVQVTEKMIGHYLGEFVLTRKRLTHGKAGIGATKSSTAITARG